MMLTLSVREREALTELFVTIGENERAAQALAHRIADLLLELDAARGKLLRICTGIDERNRAIR